MSFSRTCAPVRCASVFLGFLNGPSGALCGPPCPSHAASLLLIYPQKLKNELLVFYVCFLSGANSGRHGPISFHWTTEAFKYIIPRPSPHPLHLLISAAPNWATLNPKELFCTLLIYAAPSWATLHFIELHCTLLSYAAPSWTTLHPSELLRTLYAEP